MYGAADLKDEHACMPTSAAERQLHTSACTTGKETAPCQLPIIGLKRALRICTSLPGSSMTKHRLSFPSSCASRSALFGARARVEGSPLMGRPAPARTAAGGCSRHVPIDDFSCRAAHSAGNRVFAARAMHTWICIAREPHPIGSPANARVRDYLVAQLRSLGLQTQVQTTARRPETAPGAARRSAECRDLAHRDAAWPGD